MRRRIPILAMTLGSLLWSAAVSASPADHRRPLLTMLRAIDTIPTANAIRDITRTPEDALRRVADDDVLGQYVRRRATSLLSLFPGRKAALHLKALTASRSERVGWVATYTYIRMHGKSAGSKARSFAKAKLTSGNEGQREAVIRGLRHVPGKATVRLVTRHAAHETSKRVLAAIRRFRQARPR
jgi:hypothetical protein